jgi:hypothetical protein
MELILTYVIKSIILASFLIFFIKGDINKLSASFLLIIPFSGNIFSYKICTFYTDFIGDQTVFGFKSVILCIIFAKFLYQSRWNFCFIKNPIYFAFLIMIACGLYTQITNLNFFAGLGLTFVRIIQPLMFVIILNYICATSKGLKTIFVSIILSIAISLLLRRFSPITEHGRVEYFVSWTLYGTVIASTLPFVFAFLAHERRKIPEALFISYISVSLFEVFLTKTRGAILSIPLLGLFLLRKKPLFAYFILVITPLALLVSTDLAQMHDFQGRVFSLNPIDYLQDPNWFGRIDRNAEAMQYIFLHPVGGLGLGAPSYNTGFQLAFWVYNPYLHWGVSMGIFCMISFAIITSLSLVYAYQNCVAAKEKDKIFELAIFISLLIWILNQLTTGDSLTYVHPWEWTIFYYCPIGMILGQKSMIKEPKYQGLRHAL